jgi:hypothetical protein
MAPYIPQWKSSFSIDRNNLKTNQSQARLFKKFGLDYCKKPERKTEIRAVRNHNFLI